MSRILVGQDTPQFNLLVRREIRHHDDNLMAVMKELAREFGLEFTWMAEETPFTGPMMMGLGPASQLRVYIYGATPVSYEIIADAVVSRVGEAKLTPEQR